MQDEKAAARVAQRRGRCGVCFARTANESRLVAPGRAETEAVSWFGSSVN